MARFKIIMLSMLAVFAFSAVIASTASAHRTWWRCHKVATAKTGGFNDSLCSEPNTKKEGEWQSEGIPTGVPQGLALVKVTKEFQLKAGTETIACEMATLTGGTVENILVGGKGPTGRDKGTITFSKNCRNLAKPLCKVSEPIEVEGKETALVENTSQNKIYDLFTPAGWAEKEATKSGTFAKIKQTGTGCVATTTVEGNGVAAEITPEGSSTSPTGYSFTKILNFPCPPIKEVIDWEHALEATPIITTLKLTAFGVKAEECGMAEIELTSKEAFDVR
jgi:hypothetical protein